MNTAPAGGAAAAGSASIRSVSFNGLPCFEMVLANGARAVVAEQGAQVLSWQTADGAERLYLSPRAVFDGHSPIRGGVPVCFPQFNTRTLGAHSLPKHGFARQQSWSVESVELTEADAQVHMALHSSPASQALWPYGFAANMCLRLQAHSLHIGFSVRNTGPQAWSFALALHTYLRVAHVAQSRLTGLQGLRYWDAVQDPAQPAARQLEGVQALQCTGETDRVYEAVDAAAQPPLELHDAGQVLRIRQSANLPEVVVWNPAAERCASLADMPPDGWQQMLCVEAACINTPVVLQPGAFWAGWQELCLPQAHA